MICATRSYATAISSNTVLTSGSVAWEPRLVCTAPVSRIVLGNGSVHAIINHPQQGEVPFIERCSLSIRDTDLLSLTFAGMIALLGATGKALIGQGNKDQSSFCFGVSHC
jgi:hypothetical protein